MTTAVLSSGAKAPDVPLRTTQGEEVKLSDLWSKQKTVLVFLRHLG